MSWFQNLPCPRTQVISRWLLAVHSVIRYKSVCERMLDICTSAATSGWYHARIWMSCQSCRHSNWVLLGITIDVIFKRTILFVIHNITKRSAMLNKLLIWLFSIKRGDCLLSDNWGKYQIVAMKIYFDMRPLVLGQILWNTCSEQILYSWNILLYVYFHVTNHAWVADTKWTPCMSFILHSAVIDFLHPTQVFLDQYSVLNINCAATEQRISYISGLYDQF